MNIDERDEVLRVFVQQAPYFSPSDWDAIPPEWKIAWDAARDLFLSRPRYDASGRKLRDNLHYVGPVGIMQILYAIGTCRPNRF